MAVDQVRATCPMKQGQVLERHFEPSNAGYVGELGWQLRPLSDVNSEFGHTSLLHGLQGP